MKKLYRKGSVHPSPPVSDHLSFLPAAIFTLAAALPPEDREVLAYLISHSAAASNNHKSPQKDHPPAFNCHCFGCYTTYWARWDTSANRRVIHDVIDAYEDGLAKGKGKSRRERRRRARAAESTRPETAASGPVDDVTGGFGGGGGGGDDVAGEGWEEKGGTVRKLVSFIGESFWGVWRT